jgi:hypothetical protein
MSPHTSFVDDFVLEITLDPGIVGLTLRIPVVYVISLVGSWIWLCGGWLREGVLPVQTAKRF